MSKESGARARGDRQVGGLRRKRKAWSLWEERRVPSDYEVVSHRFHYHFRREPAPFDLDPNHPINRWYLKHREGSPFQVDDWEQFRDPARLTYKDYVTLQKDRELYVDQLIDDFERVDHYRRLPKAWVDLLEVLYIPSRFSGHVLQMSAMYWAQMAPSAYITNAGYFQGADELRRLQRSAYIAKALSLDHGEHLADSERTRAIWEDDPHWQPMREVLEKLLIAYDWGESFVATNLVVKPVYDALMNVAFSGLAEQNGDDLLHLMHRDFQLDSERAANFTVALVRYATERVSDHRRLLGEWIEKWREPAYRAAEGLAALFEKAPNGMAKEAVMDLVRASHRTFLERAGLA
ncbi:MAG: aromatic/alkene monooxygenase hydroxylase subunit beta [Hydrogenibacillus schlegelii]|uniref:propane 2-monooxygenase n=1 Tax=Hydrogenibacillus schlegelii TaxID=1484 RepID=A0A947D1W3_HYDSH|nr:aromatic/alkene monooxygenase hydroxylase subunit beta [Hydrogenibacillus schlegelii]